MTEQSYLRQTRAAYDTVAISYADLLRHELAAKPLDRALLAAFAEQVTAAGGGPVADLGCGPGRVTAHLDALGVSTFGIDLSSGMVAEARRAWPHLSFVQGTMTALSLSDGSVAGVVAWYSLIHIPPADLPPVLAELARVIVPGGQLLLAFQSGAGYVHREEAYGHRVSLVSYRSTLEQMADLLTPAGFDVQVRMLREPAGWEQVRQAYVMAQKTV